MLKLCIHMDNELLYCGIKILTVLILPFMALTLLFIYPVFLAFIFRLLKICVAVFFATHLFVAFCMYSSALSKQCSGAIVRFSDSSSFIGCSTSLGL